MLRKHIGGHRHSRDTEATRLPLANNVAHPHLPCFLSLNTFSHGHCPLKPGGKLCFVLTSVKCLSENDGIRSLCSQPYQRTELDLCCVSNVSPGTINAALELCQFPVLKSGPLYLLPFVLLGSLIGVFLLQLYIVIIHPFMAEFSFCKAHYNHLLPLIFRHTNYNQKIIWTIKLEYTATIFLRLLQRQRSLKTCMNLLIKLSVFKNFLTTSS